MHFGGFFDLRVRTWQVGFGMSAEWTGKTQMKYLLHLDGADQGLIAVATGFSSTNDCFLFSSVRMI